MHYTLRYNGPSRKTGPERGFFVQIAGVKLSRFRSYESLELTFEPGINVLTGRNGSGKTNILEAFFLCALGRSHRTSRDQELIRLGSEEGLVELRLSTRGGTRSIRAELKSGERKKVFIDGSRIEKSGELMGCLNVVMFSPEDLMLVKGAPEARRRFLDMEISQLRPAYYYALQQYNLALKQRNNLLKEGGGRPDYGMLELWDEQLAKQGTVIMRERAAFCRELAATAGGLHEIMSGGKEALVCGYEPDVKCFDESLLRESIAEALASSLEKDAVRGFTSAGPHRDDLALSVNGLDARVFASQGQQRTAALSLKLSETAVAEKVRSEKPVLLLDDVFSELDAERQRLLLTAVEDCQCFITCTGTEELGAMGERQMQLFRVQEGTVFEI